MEREHHGKRISKCKRFTSEQEGLAKAGSIQRFRSPKSGLRCWKRCATTVLPAFMTQ